jgi:hypothetical protein
MEQLREGLEAKIQSILESRRRSAFLENALLSLFYFTAGIALTFLIWFTIDLLLWIFIGHDRARTLRPANVINSLATLLFATIVLWKKHRMFEGEFDSSHESFTFDKVSNSLRTFDTLAGTVFISGPRFLVLSVRAARRAKKIRATDLFLLIRPIALAVQRRKKIRESDLAGLRMSWFIDNSAWIEGVVPLLRKPQGFTVTNDFIYEVTGEEVPEPDFDFTYAGARSNTNQEQSRGQQQRERKRRPESEPDSDADSDSDSDTIAEEVRWARMVLGVEATATRAQINAAYRKFAKIIHPDLHTNDPDARAQNEEHMKDLNLAYEILRRASG